MIVRILGEGQFRVDDDAAAKLTALDKDLDATVRDGDEPRTLANARRQFFQRKGEIFAAKNRHYGSSLRLGEERVHGKGGHDDDRFVPRIEIACTKQMNRFVHAVGQQNPILGRSALTEAMSGFSSVPSLRVCSPTVSPTGCASATDVPS